MITDMNIQIFSIKDEIRDDVLPMRFFYYYLKTEHQKVLGVQF